MKEFPGCLRPYELNRGPYDLETATELIEVKACRVKTTGMKRKGIPYLQTGRFLLSISAHQTLMQLADERARQAGYLFVLYEETPQIHILETKHMSWKSVDKLLETMRTFTRKKDGVHYAWITHKQLFNQERL